MSGHGHLLEGLKSQDIIQTSCDYFFGSSIAGFSPSLESRKVLPRSCATSAPQLPASLSATSCLSISQASSTFTFISSWAESAISVSEISDSLTSFFPTMSTGLSPWPSPRKNLFCLPVSITSPIRERLHLLRNCSNNPVHNTFIQIGVHGQAHYLLGDSFRNRETPCRPAQANEGRLQVQRYGVVHGSRNAFCLKCLLHRIPVFDLDCVLCINSRVVRLNERGDDFGGSSGKLVAVFLADLGTEF